ncbi:3-oxoacyl-[acyl-carrier protein] reductase [Aquiflexum balticum DSM 16537]|uniref:3-oxoacyl-[acyl-carrier protein] reductase n=1 Tax=Aquiflexum balticum DSM 16537 TaxID=758820 RepID=A0A1W2H4Z7_9BACT|nr:SDR family oxidoreductase [Aquiflexum balticum]SMD43536.1 3-oxoacyl-[acyl-carrier protein] reductase [Aquiflexum balticum DSM 16537]
MDLGLKGKNAIVLASSKGLGKSVAVALAQEGANVAICGRDKNTLEATKKELEKFASGRIISGTCNIMDAGDRRRFFEKVNAAFGVIDILVTNTGGPDAGSFGDFGLEDWKRFYESMFLSAVDFIQMVLPGMKDKAFGRILAITSVSVKQPVDNLISSNAVRTALLGLVKSLSNELAPLGITVNNIMPGYTMTDRLNQLLEGNPNVDKLKDSVPMKRFGKVEEFAAAAVFLLSERASYITGQSLAVDGGLIKGY